MLFLLFQLGNDRYALEANRVVEVVPLLSLKKIPQAAPGVAGMFVYHGRAIAALDLCDLTMGRPARECLSTRIIIVRAEVPGAKCQVSGDLTPDPSHLAPFLGLIAERATELMRRDVRDFQEVAGQGAKVPGVRCEVSGDLTPDPSHLAPCPGTFHREFLGPVLMDDRGVIQLLDAEKLLAENVTALGKFPSRHTA